MINPAMKLLSVEVEPHMSKPRVHFFILLNINGLPNRSTQTSTSLRISADDLNLLYTSDKFRNSNDEGIAKIFFLYGSRFLL